MFSPSLEKGLVPYQDLKWLQKALLFVCVHPQQRGVKNHFRQLKYDTGYVEYEKKN